MSNFPLFETVWKSTEETETETETIISHEDRINLMNNIKQLEKHAHEYIYLLIKIYSLEHDVYSVDDDPYQVKIFKSGLKWEISKLPFRLLKMILFFTNLELKRTHDDNQRTNFFK